MGARGTRSAAAKGVTIENSPDGEAEHAVLSSPPVTPKPRRATRQTKKAAFAQTPEPKSSGNGSLLTPLSPVLRKRKRAPIELGDINELPHNLGTKVVAHQVKDSIAAKGPSVKRSRARKIPQNVNGNVVGELERKPLPLKKASKAKKVTAEEKLGAQTDSPKRNIKEEVIEESQNERKQTRMNRPRENTKPSQVSAADQLNDPENIQAAQKIANGLVKTEESPRKGRKARTNAYGLTPGETPYPDFEHPTPEECQIVNDLLSSVHGEVKAPVTIPAPSTTVSGCGEVPSILDALIRTLLSAATTGANSSRAFQGLVNTFGLLDDGIGKGSVDWDKVRRADQKEVFEAIKSGGLANAKSKNIKAILDLVYVENMERREGLLKAKKEGDAAGPPGIMNETKADREIEIARAEQSVLSLDHLHALGSDEALNTLIKYPGIGPKTASCVLLFCMQRPSFAVDTHVFRLCKWLNWIPREKATRNSAYSHLEVRIPDNLKYPLHQLLIRHGKTCPRCRAATSESAEGWEKGCIIDHLVERTGKRKIGSSPTKKPKGKKGQKKAPDSDESDIEEDDELPTEDEDEEEDANE
ncbi:MAG: hypothetical protein M1824_005773 [Vezdaea acicularis]|nr:MAG: hypothetical protein M1824_005773 [Vezdaea acicularis]